MWQNSKTRKGAIKSKLFDELKSRLNSRNACYNSVKNRLFSCFLSKNIKFKSGRTVTLFYKGVKLGLSY